MWEASWRIVVVVMYKGNPLHLCVECAGKRFEKMMSKMEKGNDRTVVRRVNMNVKDGVEYFDGPIDMWINGCEKYTRKTNLSWLVHKLEETLDELRQVCVDDMKGLANEMVRMRKRLDECEKKIEVIQNHGCCWKE